MYRFYRMDQNEEDQDVLNIVDTCAIQGDRIPALAEKYCYVLFHLAIEDGEKMVVRRDITFGATPEAIAEVEAYLNTAEDKISLPTYFYDHIVINESERVPHLRIVYYAESEEAVWNFVNN